MKYNMRTNAVIRTILNHFHSEKDKNVFDLYETYYRIQEIHPDLDDREMDDLFSIIDENTDFGHYQESNQSFTLNRIKLDSFLQNGGLMH
ncbi:MAG: hypothetical protein KI791_09300 [Cyclobacteriaceae bacterium]|nr:hypothetical protein [Cyclobacteriaceae bacterium SS2]